jgi:DNA recombination protein RmuC
MPLAIGIVALVLLLALCALVLVLVLRRGQPASDPAALRAELDRLQAAVRAECAALRQEQAESARALRQEVSASVQELGRMLQDQVAALGNLQQQRFTEFSQRLDALRQSLALSAQEQRREQADGLKNLHDSTVRTLTAMGAQQKEQLEALRTQVAALSKENEAKLEEMRRTVDEKLHDTLEKRLGESFRQVSERLEQVHKGLGEMQTLAAGVGDLKKVLTNVKVRGTWGEIQLEALLQQLLIPEQYVKQARPKPRSEEVVEFAIRLPGRSEGDDPVLLPIDVKFPKEDYERLVDAAERADAAGVEEAGRQLEARIRQEARDIRDKYIAPPHTTDFAILYLPTEGLYAEILRRPGLAEALQRDCRVSVAGPTTIAALLNSLQLGFRSLAIQKRSSEVWKVLAAVKKKFESFGETFARAQKKIQEADRALDDAREDTRIIGRRLRGVESLSDGEAASLLALPAPASAPDEDDPARGAPPA